MNAADHINDELPRLLGELVDGRLEPADAALLTDMLREDPAARTRYLQFLLTDAMLRLEFAGTKGSGIRGQGAGIRGLGTSVPSGLGVESLGSRVESESGAIVESGEWRVESEILRPKTQDPRPEFINLQIPKSPNLQIPSLHAPLSTLHSWAVSYAVATLLVGIALLGAWFSTITHPDVDALAKNNSRRVTPSGGSANEPPQFTFVGKVSGMVDCQFADASLSTIAGAGVTLGRRYTLKSGLMEIAYDSGAKVILQGPCDYRVESRTSGFLKIGKLVARVGAGDGGRGTGDKREERGERREESEKQRPKTQDPRPKTENPKSQIPNPKSPTPHAPRPTPLFTIHTPTAVVEDLGTEFGVEVLESGATASHVFQGRVVMRTEGRGERGEGRGTDNNKSEIRNHKSEIFLSAGQSARVGPGAERIAAIADEAAVAQGFVRMIPRRIPVKIFNTGYMVAAGGADPHWEIVARSDDPTFRPRRAMVALIDPEKFLPNEYARSQWISTDRILPDETNGVTYTFRTTFDLPDAESSPVELRGRFIVDNHVSAIRLNGRLIEVPEHGYADPFVEYHTFLINKGFIAGNNVLEIDVFNGFQDSTADTATPLALRVELELFVIRGGKEGDR